MTIVLVCVPLCIILWALGIYRKQNLGRIFKGSILGMACYTSGVYDPLEVSAKKDTLETKGKKQIFHAHNNIIYKGRHGEPSMALIDGITDYGKNVKLMTYEIALSSGDNQAEDGSPGANRFSKIFKRNPHVNMTVHGPKEPTGKRFASINEARLWFNENMYIPAHKTRDPKWQEDEKRKMMQAEGIVLRKEVVTTETTSMENASGTQTTQLQQRDQIPMEPMSQAQFDEYMQEIQQRIIEFGAAVLPIEINGEVVDMRNLEKWNDSPSPENTLNAMYDKGFADGQALSKNQLAEAMKYVLIIMGIGVCVFLIEIGSKYL